VDNGGVIFSENESWKEQRRFVMHTMRDFGMGRNLMEEKILNSVATMVTQVRLFALLFYTWFGYEILSGYGYGYGQRKWIWVWPNTRGIGYGYEYSSQNSGSTENYSIFMFNYD
jgi:hypothetical protein